MMMARTPVAAAVRPLPLFCYVVLTLLLLGCRTVPKPVAPVAAPAEVVAGWPARRAQLQNRAAFTAQGKIGVVTGSDGFSGHLRWVQEGTRSTVSLDGPLGVGGVRITDDGGMLTLTNPSGQALDSQAAHDELVRRMGFEPPLESLRFWIQGVPDPSSAASEMPGELGYLDSLQQAGWTVSFGAYMQTDDGTLPQKVTVERGTVRVRLILESWHTP